MSTTRLTATYTTETDERNPHDGGIVEIGDGIDGVETDPRPVEDGLDQEISCQKIANLQTQHRQCRDECISHDVASRYRPR